ncbi:hypothetical protein ACFQZT_28550 [Paenibacillus sp. GCM10027628]|uniref:hypothetical protein n=1 Tax=Paenibacillus sp. GCM10027628 TaxID=3273413 RepID=UPI0036287AC9
MKYINIIILIIILQGCSTNKDINSVDDIPIVDTVKEQSIPSEKDEINNKEVVTDISSWVHPTKEYINSIGTLEKVEIKNKKITFYLTTKGNGNFSYEIFSDLAKYNDFQDYKIISIDSELKARAIDITCSKPDKRVIKIVSEILK